MTRYPSYFHIIAEVCFLQRQWPSLEPNYPYCGSILKLPMKIADHFYDCAIGLHECGVAEISAGDTVRVGIQFLDPEEALKVLAIGDHFTLGFSPVAEGTVVTICRK